MAQHIFFILLNIPAEHEAKFNAVYDNDHLPYMLQNPGVRDCSRYKLEWSDNPDMLTYLALYHIDEPELPRSAAWKKQSALGRWPAEIRPLVTARRNGVLRQIFHTQSPSYSGGPYEDSTASDHIYFLQQAIPAELDAKFNELYNDDHIPLMVQAPGVRGCTRYKIVYSETGDVPDYLAIYAIDKIDTPRSPEWKKRTNLGAWPTQMRPHFTARRNGVYRRISRIMPR